MKILVCISNVPDTTTKIKFAENNTRFDATGVQWIINPWDELALTRALELKEASGGKIEKVTVITVGETDSEPTIRKALAIGADDAIRVSAKATDAFFVAGQLADVAGKEGYDVILSGIESSDYNGSAVGGMIAEFMGIQSVSSVSGIELDGDKLKIFREIDGGKETILSGSPIVAIVQKGIAINPRIPSMRGIMMARQKTLAVKEAVAMDSLTDYSSYEMPPAKGKCRFIDPGNMNELVNL
ncbi:MAG: electron transfer flavoprotein subunit beta/FixA family protein, partial [Bacteroidota bacterium]